MQNENEKLNKFKEQFLKNLSEKTLKEMCAGQWKIVYDGDEDEFMWINPTILSSESSLLFPIDDCLGMSVNKDTAEIEYFVIQDFQSVFVKQNSEWKKFAHQVVKLRHGAIEEDIQENAVKKLAGELLTCGQFFKVNALGFCA